jgi:hypothetical protein
MYVENVYNGVIYNLAHHRMSAIIRYLWARKYRAAAVSHGVPHQMDPVDIMRLVTTPWAAASQRVHNQYYWLLAYK